jgi:hypothetical protein
LRLVSSLYIFCFFSISVADSNLIPLLSPWPALTYEPGDPIDGDRVINRQTGEPIVPAELRTSIWPAGQILVRSSAGTIGSPVWRFITRSPALTYAVSRQPKP